MLKGRKTELTKQGQGYSLALVQGYSDLKFSNFFSLETACPIESRFHVDPPWDWGTNICSNDQGHMTKMAAMPIYGRSIENSSFLEQND